MTEQLINLNVLDVSSKSISAKVNEVILQVEEGQIDPLKVHIIAKALAKMGSSIAEKTIDYAMTEAGKYGRDNSLIGARFQTKSLPDCYDFDADPEYKELKQRLKAREDLLKEALKSKGQIVDEDGAIVPKVPVKKAGGSTIAVTF